MTELATAAPKSKTRKVLLQATAGALCGFFGMLGGFWLIDRSGEGLPPPAVVFGLGVGMIYLLIGLLLCLGTLAPRFGEKALNVEDADEIVEERPNLLGAAVFCLLVAGFILALTLAPSPLGAGIMDKMPAAFLSGAAAFGLVIVGYAYRNHGDELMRRLNSEADALTLTLALLLFGSWAALAQLGLAEMFGPLPFIAGLFALQMLAIFVVVGRRGMLKPR